MSLEFRLLGPLEVWDDGRQVRIGGERQRALLALLLLHVNEVVPSERLIEELLGVGEVARDSANVLQVNVSRLRRRLESRSDRLITRPRGYLLRADADELDCARFERLVERGRALLAAGDPVAAGDTLREGLALWRGPALADLTLHDFAQLETRRLDDLRLGAVLDRIECDLALGGGPELVAELEALAAANPLQERIRAQLMLALYRSGRQAEALDVYRQTRTQLNEELGLEPSRALQQLERAILNQDAELDAAGLQAAESPPVCPFKGLASFEAADAAYFFGRERLVDTLVARAAGSTLVAVVGASGSGKSSLLRAGFVPALAEGVLPGSEGWPVTVLRPGEHPRLDLERPPRDARAVVVVDQLEEVFSICRDAVEREAFLDALVDAAEDPDRRFLFVVAIRADVYGRFAEYPRAADLLSRSHVLVGPMSRAELGRAIELPAARAGLQVEPELVDALVADVADAPGSLPLLSAALLELWGNKDGRVLRLESYHATGGVRGSVARLAEAAFARLSEHERDVARAVLLRLSSGDEEPVRRQAQLGEFGAEPAVAHVLHVLTSARLVTVDDGTVEVAHEALLREWPRLRGWLEEDREGRLVHRRLIDQARDWKAGGRDAADLYRGARLAVAADWASTHHDELNALERDFLTASQHRARRELRRLRVAIGALAAVLALAVAAGVVAFVQRQSARNEAQSALAGRLAALALSEPRIDRALLLAREAVRIKDAPQTEGALLGTLLRSPSVLGTFALPIDTKPYRIAVSPDARTLAVGDQQGALRFYDTRTRRERGPPLRDVNGYWPAVYSSDGSVLAAGAPGDEPGVELLDAHTLRPLNVFRLDGHADRHELGAVTPLMLDAHARRVAAAYDLVVSSDGREGPAYLDVWDRAGRTRTAVRLGSPDVLGAGLTGDRRRIVTVTSRRIETWDAATLRRLHAVTPGSTTLGGYAAVSPDGRRVAGLGADGLVFVDATTGKVTSAAPGGHTGGILSLRFSPDSRLLATTGADGKVIVWAAATGEPIDVFTGHGGITNSSDFTPDGRTLYSSGLDGAIFEWDVSGQHRFGRPIRLPVQPRELPQVPQTPPLAVDPRGGSFAVRAGTRSVALYSLASLRPWASFRVNSGIVTAIAWSRAGSLAVGTRSGTIEEWRTDGTPILARKLNGRSAVQALAFDASGRHLAAADLDHLVIWTGVSGRPAEAVPLGQQAWSVALSRDGTLAATGLNDGRVLVVDARNGRVERTLHPLRAPNVSVAFAPDGTILTGSFQGILQRWSSSTGAEIGLPIRVAAGPVSAIALNPLGALFATSSLAEGNVRLWRLNLQQFGGSFPGPAFALTNTSFTADGRELIVAFDNGTGVVWPVTLDAWTTHACAVADRNLTHDEWNQYVPGRSYQTTCARR